MVCSGFTATRFLRNRFLAVNGDSLPGPRHDLGRRVSTMQPSWCRQIQFGMHGFCSYSQPHHKPTPDPKRLTVHSCQCWKHMTILKMVIIVIIAHIDISFDWCCFIVIIVIIVLIELI
jgi:hypothetical protein